MDARELSDSYGGWWGEHPVYRVENWLEAVTEGGTRNGYWDWVLMQLINE